VARPRPPRPEPLTPEEEAALRQAGAAHLVDLYEVLTGTGKHADHEREQIGRCVFCSCGTRVQGRMEASRG
jgi:hypothetical protein